MSYETPIGIVTPPTGSLSAADHVKIGTVAEKEGLDFLLVPETWGYEAFTRLGYIAAQTDRIRLGTGVVPVQTRTPSLIGQSAATLAEISDRDVILGIGPSSEYIIERWHGIPFESTLRWERETIEIVNQILSGEPVDYDGELYELEHYRLRFDPPDANIPTWVAALGEHNCRLTGAFGDGWFPHFAPLSGFDTYREYIERGANEQNRDPDEVKMCPSVTACVLNDGEHAKDRCREEIAFYIGAMGDYLHRTVSEHGYPDTADEIRDRWEEGDKETARDAVTDELLRELAISGTPEEAQADIENYAAVSDEIALFPSKSANHEEIIRTIQNVGAYL